MESILESYLVATVVAVTYFSLWYLFALVKNNISVIDIGWGIGFIVVGLATLLYNDNLNNATLLMFNLVLVWAARLSLHVTMRQWHHGEDPRYSELRKKWKTDIWWNAYIRVFMGQAFSLLIISFPIIVVNSYATDLENFLLPYIGATIWSFGFLFEFFADYQLYKFKNLDVDEKKKHGWRGKVMKYGLWSYSRHPNYFGEILMWIGIYIFAINYPLGVFGFISPLYLTIAIIFITGVKRVEARYEGNRNYQKYKSCTSMIVPLPPRETDISKNAKKDLSLSL